MFDSRAARLARLICFGALLAPVLAAAQLRPVAPGETPQLAGDEALLLVAVDSDVPLSSARVKHEGEYTDLGRIEAGTHYQLYVAEAGHYGWRDVVEAGAEDAQPLDLADFSFDLTAGELNYAGDMVVRSGVEGSEAVVLTNRGLKAMDWMSRAFPRIKKKHVFRYAGNVPDGFPAYYGALAATATGRSRTASPARDLPVAVEAMFQPTAVTLARMDPAGTQVALKRRDAAGAWRIELLDLQRGTARILERDAVDVAGLEWSAHDTLLVARGEAGQAQQVTLSRIEDGEVRERIALPVPGVVIDTLPSDETHLLLATAHDGRWMVHKVDVSSPAAARSFRPEWNTRLNRGGGDEVAWYADAHGELRLAMALHEEGYVFTRGGEVAASVAQTGFQPVAASADAGRLYGVTDEQRAQRELVEFDVAAGRTRTLFARAGVDVEAPIFDAQRRPIGVTYYDDGRLASEYFAAGDRELDAKLRARFPTQSVAVLDRSADGRRLLLSVEGADEVPALWRFDADGQARRLAIGIDALAGVALAPTRVLTVRAKDGLAVEALLTVPKGEGRKPLVVMPHGGPIAVADRLHFNRETQFLAALGYAVLRVNFRGSDGYGRAFREAGHGQYGRGIEDDIDAAIEQVGEQVAEIDTGRMCMLGASYGGYSALVSAARWPQRFRCAVSISGISDLSLMFSASDAGRSEEGRRLLTQLIGDPVAQAAELREVSPAYFADRIQAPVMLVHGADDRRVDPEHFHRMQRVLERHGKAPAAMLFDGEGHGIELPENVRAMWEGIAGFLAQNL